MCSITGLRHSKPTDLVALSCDDLSIRVIDIETKKLVRELWGSIGQVNDFSISNDGRWVIATSMDSVIRVWDVPTGHLIDAFRPANTCTSLAFSESGEFLATAHADSVGINLWSNRTMFTYVPTARIDENSIPDTSNPTPSGEGGAITIDAAFEENDEKHSQLAPSVVSEQLSSDLMTLSVTPKSRWQTLVHLDIVKVRPTPAYRDRLY
jgi:U3 small nucleolar RNA-associated protein 21